MKTWLKWRSFLPVIAILLLFFYVSCSEPSPDPPVDPDPATTEEDPGAETEATNKFLNALVFANGSKVAKALPAATNTEEVKMTVEDTIYVMEGVRITKPAPP